MAEVRQTVIDIDAMHRAIDFGLPSRIQNAGFNVSDVSKPQTGLSTNFSKKPADN